MLRRLPPRRPARRSRDRRCPLAGCTPVGLHPHRRRHRDRHQHDVGHGQARPRPAHRGRSDAVRLLNSVQRALNGRCEYVPGSIRRPTSQERPAGVPAHRRDARRAPVACPARADRERRAATNAARARRSRTSPKSTPARTSRPRHARDPEGDRSPRRQRPALRPPRRLSHAQLPSARAVGLDRVLVGWLDRGELQPGTLSFSPLEALDPDLLVTRFGRELEVAGHLPSAALDHYDGACRTASSKRSERATGPRSNGGSTSCRSSPTWRRRAAARRWPGCRCSACCCPATCVNPETQADMVAS